MKIAATSKVEFKSPAEFFANNKNIAGFDNPGKSLYTTVREMVENALDAAESIEQLADIHIEIEELTEKDLYAVKGISKEHKRLDESLYLDFDKNTKKKAPKRVKLSQEQEEEESANVSDSEESKRKQAEDLKGKSGPLFYRVTVKDNGCGMQHDDIPNMLGRVLSGTKYGVKQARGKYGLGAKMALLWSKMSTGCPVEIVSSQGGTKPVSYYRLDIDIIKNLPKVVECRSDPNKDHFRGTKMSVIIEGNWSSYRAKILQYLRQLAIITPYAFIEFRFKTAKENKSFAVRYARRSNVVPDNPKEIKHHPSSVNLLLIKKLSAESIGKKHTFLKFLLNQFSNIDANLANSIISELGDGFYPEMMMEDFTEEMALRLNQLFKQMKFPPPDGQCLSPAGEYNLRLGIIKELHPDLIATFQEKPMVYEGHPFIVEAAVSLGGKSVSPGLNIYRFANRIPLLFEAGADVVSRTATAKIKWQMYKIKPNIDKIGVFVSIELVSTKIPFKGTGKEYIGDDADEIALAVKKAIQQCCLQLKIKLGKAEEHKLREERKQNLTKYIPNVSRSIQSVLSKIDVNRLLNSKYPMPSFSISTTLTSSEITQLVDKVKSKTITQKSIADKLTEHAEKADIDQALDYVSEQQKKVKKVSFFLLPKSSQSKESIALNLHDLANLIIHKDLL